jgi:hypothetical protein
MMFEKLGLYIKIKSTVSQIFLKLFRLSKQIFVVYNNCCINLLLVEE